MRLVTDNAQGELSPLEIGLHALGNVTLESGGAGKTGGLREYARQIGKGESYLRQIKSAAEVFKTAQLTAQFSDKAQHLYEVSRAPESVWPQLCAAIEEGALVTVDDVSKAVARVKAIDAALVIAQVSTPRSTAWPSALACALARRRRPTAKSRRRKGRPARRHSQRVSPRYFTALAMPTGA